MAGQTKLNPFAAAMQANTSTEMASVAPGDQETPTEQLFDNAGAVLPTLANQNESDGQADFAKEQEELKEQERKAQLALERHALINPDNQTKVFEAQARQDKVEEEQLIEELRALAAQKQIPQVEQPKVLDAPVTITGDRGTDANGLFSKAKQLIEKFIPQNWAQTFQNKQRRKGPGAQTKAVWDTFHHERATGATGA
ncbi:MAG: hypothetical protein ABII10_01755 [Candidatus Paceibacterota bacterium]